VIPGRVAMQKRSLLVLRRHQDVFWKVRSPSGRTI
jgi:hypothetical protein